MLAGMRWGLLLLLVGCGESFQADRQPLSTPEPSGSGGEEQTGGAQATGGSGVSGAPTGGSSAGSPAGMGGAGAGSGGSMSGSGVNPSGAGGDSGESGAGGEPWLPSRCVEPTEGLQVTPMGPWEVEVFLQAPWSAYLHEIEARYWLAPEAECTLEPGWWVDGRSRDLSSLATLRVEPEEHATPEGTQTHVMVLGQLPRVPGEKAIARQLLYFGGCSPMEDTSNNYSASAPEHVAIYVRGELVAGCEP